MKYGNSPINEDSRLCSVCGTDCGLCSCRGSLCQGCSASEGRVFHSPEGCPIYRCVRERKGLPDCGRCGELPCAIWEGTRDPKFTDEGFRENIAGRVARLRQGDAGQKE